MCCHKGTKSDTSQHKKVKVKLLENWLKPRLEPHPWKYRLGKIFKKWGDEYQKEVEHSKRTSNALFGPDGDTVSHLTATHLTGDHESTITVTYDWNSILIFKEPALAITGWLVFFSAIVVIARLDFSIKSKTDPALPDIPG